MTKDSINYLLWKRFPWLAIKLHSVGNNTVLDNAEFMKAYLDVLADGAAFLSLRDMFNLYSYVSRARLLEGDMAEVGVFQGRGAKFISLFKGDARLHLFDTFAGMPETDRIRDNYVRPGDFGATSLEQVRVYLGKFSNIEYHKGVFPETASIEPLASRKFSFVHLDTDLFQSTLDGLRFFYPRLVESGVLISHDYSSKTCHGVKEAFDIFCGETGVVATPLWDTQCLIVKSNRTSSQDLVLS